MSRPYLDSKVGPIALCAIAFFASGCSLIGGSRGEKAPPEVIAPAPVETPVETTAPATTTAIPDETTPPAETTAEATTLPPDETAPPSETAVPSESVAPSASVATTAQATNEIAAPKDPAPKDDKQAKDEGKANASKQAKENKKKGKGKDKDAAVPTAPVIPPQALQSFNEAVAQLNAGGLAQAEQTFRTLSVQYPQYAGPLVNLGILYAKAERFEEAEKMLQEALRRSPANPIVFNELGIVYRRLGRFEDADSAYTQALRIDPNYALAHLNLGVLCDLYLQQPERALQAFERYLAIVPEPSPQVSGWVSELKNRLAASQRSAEVKE